MNFSNLTPKINSSEIGAIEKGSAILSEFTLAPFFIKSYFQISVI